MINARQIMKKPVVYEIVLCVFLIILIRIVNFWQYLIYNIAGVNTVTDILAITGHVLVFAIAIGVGLRDQKRTLASVCFFKKTSANV